MRISNNSKTDYNSFCNIPTPLVKNSMSSKLESLGNFFILQDIISNSPSTKYDVISHDCKTFSNKSFLEDFEKINWIQVLKLSQNNVNITFENYLNTVKLS